MPFITADRVADTSTTTGTGSITVSGTAPTGYRTFSSVLSVADTFYYAIQHQTLDEWEVGLGTYSSANEFARTTVLSSSNAGSAVSFGAGDKDVFITLAADRTVQQRPTGEVAITATGTDSALRITQTGAGNALLVEDSANPDATPFVVSAAGNVGIGTTTPAVKLDVLGDVSIGANLSTGTGVSTGAVSIELGGNRTGSGSAFIDFHAVTGTDNSARIIRNGGANGQFIISSTGTGAMMLRNAGAAEINFDTSNLERMRITSGGNVGIGTSAPATPFHVVGTSFFNGSIGVGISTPRAPVALYQNAATAVVVATDNSLASWSFGVNSSGNFAIFSNNSNNIQISTSGLERMRITSGGNVGIGTSAPAVPLDVVGQINDAIGNVRDIPPNARTSAYTLVLSDNGKHISITTGGVTVPASVFVVGDVVSIYNNSSTDQTITPAGGVTMYLSGTTTTGAQTITARTFCRIVCVASDTFVLSGTGQSSSSEAIPSGIFLLMGA